MKKLMFLIVFCAVSIFSAQAQKTFSGKVIGPDGLGLPGVSVVEKANPANGFATDIDGNWTLTVPDGNSILQFTAIGMKAIEIAAKDAKNLKMLNDAQVLDEVMVVAYGTAKKSSFTGSAASVSQEKLEKIQTSDASKALEGSVAGVTISSESGSPGAPTTIRIRGIGSINASSAPLIIVDGAPYTGSLNTINPADISSYTVLKDAASAALYGARGANGVVVITTKSGKTGKTTVSFDAKVGYNYRGVPEYDVIRDPATYYETMWRSLYNNSFYDKEGANGDVNLAKKYANENLFENVGYNIYDVPNGEIVIDGKINSKAKIKYPDKDWGDWEGKLFEPGLRQEYNVAVTKGTEQQKAFFSIGYLDDKGYSINTFFKRLTSRFKYDAEVFSWLKFSNNVQYTNSKRNSVREGNNYTNTFAYTRNMPPIYPIWKRNLDGSIVLTGSGKIDPKTGKEIMDKKVYDDGTINRTEDNKLINGKRSYAANSNLYATQKEDLREVYTDILSNNAGITITLPYNFEFSTNLTLTKEWYKWTIYQAPILGDAKAFIGRSTKERESNEALNFNQILRWEHTFANDINLTAMVGHESFQEEYSTLFGTKTGFLDIKNTELTNATKYEELNSYSRDYKLEGYFAQLTASYAGKYYMSLSARRDASSVFHPDSRWGSFWSLGGSWRVSEEKFFESMRNIFSNLKLKASYGAQGNDYLYLPNSLDRNYLPYENIYSVESDGTDLSLVPKYMGNKDVTWEKNHNFNVGLEFTLTDNILNGEIEFFQRKTTDMLFNLPVPQSTGFTTKPVNIGDMKNTGVEASLNAAIINNDNFKWNFGVNLTHYKNEITRLPEEFRKDGIVRGYQILKEGGSIYDFNIVRWGGVDPNTGESLYMLKDKEEDTEYKAQPYDSKKANFSKQNVGTSLPDLQGGFSTDFEFYGFDLSLQFSYALGGQIFDYQYSNLMDVSQVDANWHKDILKSWTPETKDSKYPRLEANNRDLAESSDRFLTDASYLAFRNVTLGYTLPKEVIKKIGVSSLRMFLVADNVALWSKRQGLDPRMSIDGGRSAASYSPIQAISFGVNVKL